MSVWRRLAHASGFDWDPGNLGKSWEAHQVAFWEAEQIFFNRPLVVLPDAAHSQKEERFYTLGKTDSGRRLFVVFTMRETRIRVISARDMTGKERKEYMRHEQAEEAP